MLDLWIPLTAKPAEHTSEKRADFSRIAHVSWTGRDGAPSEVVALAQTTDGYLWIGTPFGLYRFDGLRFSTYPFSPEAPKLLSADISSLAADQNGGLWIGYRHGGISHLSGGSLISYSGGADVEGRSTDQIVLRQDGSVWMVANGKILYRHDSEWVNYGALHGLPDEAIFTIFFDREGNLWTSSRFFIYRVQPGAARFSRLDAVEHPVTQFAETEGGEIWISNAWVGVRPVHWNCTKPTSPLLGFANMLIDSEQRLWLGEDYQGVSLFEPKASACNVALPRDHFTAQRGLTSDRTLSLLQDKDGNIWVGTSRGIDRFHTTIFKPYTRKKINFFPAIAAGRDGSVWIGVHGERLVLSANRSTRPIGQRRGSSPLHVDINGTLWMRDPWDFRIHCYAPDGRSTLQVDSPEAFRYNSAQSITTDLEGSLYVAFENKGLWRYREQHWTLVQYPMLPSDTPIALLTTSDGRVWCSYSHNRIAALYGDRVSLYTEEQGVTLDNVLTLYEEKSQLWAAGSNGIVSLRNGRFERLNVQQPNLMIGISGLLIDKQGDLWANGGAGIIQIASNELLQSISNSNYAAKTIVYAESDGISGSATQLKPNPSAIKDGTGRLWFARSGSLVTVDSMTKLTRRVPPTIDLQHILLDDVPVKPTPGTSRLLSLRGGRPNRLEFDFVGVDLSTPERVIYRYRLEGEDKDWQQSGDRRQAFYAHLAPGSYVFHVSASNGNGNWSQQEPAFYVDVQPAFYETNWFSALSLLASSLLIWVVYLLRIRHVTSRIGERLKQRENERLRIARELHDTLLQSIHGLMLRFHFAMEALSTDDPARPALHLALERADALILEGRNRVQDLRGEHQDTQTFPDVLAKMAQELNREGSVEIQVSEEGNRHLIRPDIQNELVSILRECLVNALTHAKATQIDLEVLYRRRSLRVVCKDNGVGIPASVVREGGKKGHWGMKGMKERAQSISAHLELWSTLGKGTEIEVAVASSIAYVQASPLRTRLFSVRRKQSI